MRQQRLNTAEDALLVQSQVKQRAAKSPIPLQQVEIRWQQQRHLQLRRLMLTATSTVG